MYETTKKVFQCLGWNAPGSIQYTLKKEGRRLKEVTGG